LHHVEPSLSRRRPADGIQNAAGAGVHELVRQLTPQRVSFQRAGPSGSPDHLPAVRRRYHGMQFQAAIIVHGQAAEWNLTPSTERPDE
jgi:hypothetical protein